MASIQVFDPALCCSTGVCGVDVDQKLVDFAADVDWAKQNGADIERFNLAQQPIAFAENPVVNAFLQHAGAEGLPLILLNGEIALSGSYPSREQLAQWIGANTPDSKPLGEQVVELIALGAAVAAGCEPCFKFHYDKARKLGLTVEAMQQAVDIGDMVKRASAQNMLDLAGRVLEKRSPCCKGSSTQQPDSGNACCR
jgi:AhpD family alkylhydroperoxidase